MNILPMNRAEADRRHWVVRMLRYFGYLWAVAGIVSGVVFGNNIVGFYIATTLGSTFEIGSAIGIILGGFLGFVGGLIVGLPFWGLSMLIDDLHAVRQYMQGFVAVKGKDE